MELKVLFAGFGGQGILFSGKFLAYLGLLNGKEVTHQPSYGPEMKGGTANCGVILSDTPVGSPIVLKPDVLIAMNLPSLDKFEDKVAAGGKIIVDSSLIERKVKRADVEAVYIPATQIAADEGLTGLANMIILGRMIKATGMYTLDDIPAAMEKTVSARKKALFDSNIKAIQIGYEHE